MKSSKVIDVYSWPTPNGHKVHIMLEECGLAYRVHPVNIARGEQFDPAFLSISPNNKIPALSDPDGPDGKPIHLFESGAILLYLASKTGRFLPSSARGKFEVLQWLMFQMASVGPMLGQTHHFRIYAQEKIPYAIDRYTNETRRLYGVMDKRLATSPYLGGGLTPSQTSRYTRGCARGRTKALIGTITPTSKRGLTRSKAGLRCKEERPCSVM